MITDEEFAGKDWQGIALVIQVEPRKRLFGYRQQGRRRPEATPPAARPSPRARELADAMKIEGKRRVEDLPGPDLASRAQHRDRFRVRRPQPLDVTPANPKAWVEELRPR